MNLEKLRPSKTLNKAYYKQSLSREQIELFKRELQNTFNHIDEKQDEEYHKNVIADLFKNVYCKDKYLVNVNKKEDLVIRLGNATTDDVGVLLEFKKPTEKRDMVSAENANVKALQEAILYYLRQTVDNDNHKITNIVITNIYEWFIFDGVWFEKNIFRNAKLKKDYLAFKTSGHDTKYFYDTIAAKYLAEFTEKVPCTYFNLLDYKDKITNDNPNDDNDLIDLYKILSPEHLLNKNFVNDSNSLNTDFYNELLYIIGLEESKDTAKKTIRRINEAERNEGSLIENTISKLKTKKYFGYENNEETENKYYEVALELCITWLNRILFLKLLESQLIKYHRSDKENYSFLTSSKIKEFDDLEELFFEVLAEKTAERKSSVATKYKDIPYLNSSLFEMTDLEKNALSLSNLKDRLEFPVHKKSVLKKGTKDAIKPKTSLNYLLDFLDAYNFASESNAKIQEENKSIINASVLGLIFEKINGYKDGSFFTPGFITMYMCRETIRKAVVEKFKTNFPYCQDITDYEELKDKIDYKNKAQRLEANRLINDIKIVDPAVGSGHFLVSALNEMIAIKSDLQILSYTNDNRVLGYTITLDNDELIIQNQETDKLFEYTLNQNNNIITDLQDLQECLFHEKQTIIENCLFGVDINPKSVMICQLRLWIELLKNAYYVTARNEAVSTKDYFVPRNDELQTLPNIDINIKTGNSLISKFAIKDNLIDRIPKFEQKLQEYKNWVHIYKNEYDKGAKHILKKKIESFKNEFNLVDPRIKEIEKRITEKSTEILLKYKSDLLFNSDLDEKQKAEKQKWENELENLIKDKEDVLSNPIYANAFEWRFEFPEVLDDKGNFVGFDVVIGNPPYISVKELDKNQKDIFIEKYFTAKEQFDLYNLFIEKSIEISIENGVNSLIIPDSFLGRSSFKTSRKYLFEKTKLLKIIHLDKVFDDANVSSCIYFLENKIQEDKEKIEYVKSKNSKEWNLGIFEIKNISFLTHEIINSYRLLFLNETEYNLLIKIFQNKPINSEIESWRGEELGKKNNQILNEKVENSIQILTGENIDRYSFKKNKNYILEQNIQKNIKRYRKNKIVIRQLCSEINAFLDDSGSITIQSVYNLYSKNEKISNEFLLGLLNSKIFDFIFKKIFSEKQQFPRILLENIRNLTIPKYNRDIFEKIENLVNQILSLKKENTQADTSDLENQIDEMVYQLYELTPEEIDIIKNN
jgi:adenine-specific DNA-methyltransferase